MGREGRGEAGGWGGRRLEGEEAGDRGGWRQRRLEAVTKLETGGLRGEKAIAEKEDESLTKDGGIDNRGTFEEQRK